MSKRLTSTRRQRRELKIPAPSRKGNIKIPLAGWISCARVVLIEEGIGAVKVDRLAKRLNVTRGGFYYHFNQHHKLLEALLDDWRRHNCFTPAQIDASSPAAALEALQQISDNLVHERGFDPQYDMAIREWARISQPVADVVHEVDEQRVEVLRRIFSGLGCKPKEAAIRARVYYWHQIGYYAIGVREDTGQRESNLQLYLEVLGGEKYLEAIAGSRRSSAAAA
ncbi:MAG TPA: TetR/AcrR family transcriptional regulator [Nevskiaceae bacterium]|nr:TetR/AcrR family transcriptional regulator [Nevskiaceae bacterium]